MVSSRLASCVVTAAVLTLDGRGLDTEGVGKGLIEDELLLSASGVDSVHVGRVQSTVEELVVDAVGVAVADGAEDGIDGGCIRRRCACHGRRDADIDAKGELVAPEGLVGSIGWVEVGNDHVVALLESTGERRDDLANVDSGRQPREGRGSIIASVDEGQERLGDLWQEASPGFSCRSEVRRESPPYSPRGWESSRRADECRAPIHHRG